MNHTRRTANKQYPRSEFQSKISKARFQIQRLRKNSMWRSVPTLEYGTLAEAESALARLRRGRSANTLRIFPQPSFAEACHAE